MDPAQALADLKEISTQIEAAVVVGPDGSPLAATVDDARAADLAEAARELLDAAARTADAGRAVAQLEVATRDGCVFVVRDEERAIAATTGLEPTVGLVFYDLKSTLRSIAAGEKPKPKRREREAAGKADTGAEEANGDAAA
jgi:predicted regulator of Ras-like GTPase activity (Roadblock/LC7/MglB family)